MNGLNLLALSSSVIKEVCDIDDPSVNQILLDSPGDQGKKGCDILIYLFVVIFQGWLRHGSGA
jgi:hypothetical protein